MSEKRSLRVAFCAPLVGLGGGETSLLGLMGALRRRGHRPVLVCPSEGRLTEAARNSGLEVVVERFGYPPRVGGLWVPSPAQAEAMLRLLRKMRPDLVHVNDFRPCIHLCLAAQPLRLPVVWTVHGPWQSTNILSKQAARRLCDRALAVSEFVAASLRRASAVPEDRLRVVPLGVDTGRFSPAKGRIGVWRPWGISDDHKIVISLVRFQKVKGLDLMLEVARLLLRQRPNVRLAMVGDYLTGDEEERQYGARISAAIEADPVLRAGVVRIPFQQKPEDLLASAHVYLCTSEVESFGQAVVEAMGCGLPAVVTDCGGPTETVVDGETGLIVRSGQPEDLAEAVARLLDDEPLRRSLGERARQRALDAYSLPRYADKVEEQYLEILKPT